MHVETLARMQEIDSGAHQGPHQNLQISLNQKVGKHGNI